MSPTAGQRQHFDCLGKSASSYLIHYSGSAFQVAVFKIASRS